MQMDIRGILKEQADRLLDAEIDLLADELTLGDYDAAYRDECRLLIDAERKKRKTAKAHASDIAEHGEEPPDAKGKSGSQLPSGVSGSVLVPTGSLSPFNNVEVPEKTPFETVSADVTVIRRAEKRKSLFREYLDKQQLLNEELLDAHFSFFDDWEMGAILDGMQLSEAFLDKYFDVLDHDRVARKQLFSEEFFMRHFGDMDAALVLQKGKNSWRAKDMRSKKLDMFLRLKGVRF